MKNPKAKTQSLQETVKKVVNALKSYSTANTTNTTKVDNNTMLAKGNEPTAKTASAVKTDFTTDTKTYTPTKVETEKGKTFVPETNVKTSPTVIAELNDEKVQNALKAASDESNEKFINAVSPIVNGVKNYIEENKKANEEYRQQRMERYYERNAKAYEEEEKERTEINNSTTQEDLNNIYNTDGSAKDYTEEIKTLEDEINSLNHTIKTSYNNNEKTIAEESIKDKQERLDYLNNLSKKKEAWEESYNLGYLKSQGDETAYNSYRDMLAHKNDKWYERVGTSLSNVLTKTFNTIPSAIEEFKLTGQTNVANDNIQELNKLHEDGKISDEIYEESLEYWNKNIEEYRNQYNDGISQDIRAVSEQLNANTYYGASDVEKFLIQANESNAQFLLHLGLAIATGGTSELATVGIATQSGTEKFNQLIQEGYDAETAWNNGTLTGIVSYIVERIGMDRFVNMLGTPVSVSALGSIILSKAKSAVSEGLEEVEEGLIDPLVDTATLGVDYEVDGTELLTSFMMAGASSLMLGIPMDAYNTANTAINVNKVVKENEVNRADLINKNNAINNSYKTGTYVVNSVQQRNALQNEIDLLMNDYDTMTDFQMGVADEEIAKARDAIDLFNNKSVGGGIELSTDYVEPFNIEDANKTIISAGTPQFNQEVRLNQELDAIQNNITENINKLTDKYNNLNAKTQELLESKGYSKDNIDAKVFNSLDEKRQNETLVALDFAKQFGLNINATDNVNLGAKGENAKGVITIDVTKSPILATLAHELTHGVEASKYYPQLKEFVKSNYKGDWNKAIENIDEKELVAQEVEKYLNDENFINRLTKYNYSLAHKVYYDVKALASNDVKTQLENKFDKAFVNNPNITEDTKYSTGGEQGLINLKEVLFDTTSNRYRADLKNKTVEYKGETITYEELYNRLSTNKTKADDMRTGTYTGDITKIQKRPDGEPYTEEEIREETGWWLDTNVDSKRKFDFYDDGSINKIAQYVKDHEADARDKNFDLKRSNTMKNLQYIITNDKTIRDIIGDDNLTSIMYPEILDSYFVLVKTKGFGGQNTYFPFEGVNVLEIPIENINAQFANDKRAQTSLAATIAHELMHQMQRLEGFKKDVVVNYRGKSPNYISTIKSGEAEAVRTESAQKHPELRDTEYLINGDLDAVNAKLGDNEFLLEFDIEDGVNNVKYSTLSKETKKIVDAVNEYIENEPKLKAIYHSDAEQNAKNILRETTRLVNNVLQKNELNLGYGLGAVSYKQLNELITNELKTYNYSEDYKKILTDLAMSISGFDTERLSGNIDLYDKYSKTVSTNGKGNGVRSGSPNAFGNKDGKNPSGENGSGIFGSDFGMLEEDDSETGSRDDTWEYSEGESYDSVEAQSASTIDEGAKVLEDPDGAQEEAEEKIAQVLTENPNTESGKVQVRKLLDRVKYYLSDFGVYIDNFAKSVGNEEISHKYDYMLSSNGMANNALASGHYDIYGRQIDKGISKVFEGIKGETKQDFFNYLYHYRNYDEMTISKRKYGKLDEAINANAEKILQSMGVSEINGKHYMTMNQDGVESQVEITEEAYANLQKKAYEEAKKNTTIDKPVFGKTVTAEDSMKIIKELEAKYNGEGTFNFKELAKQVWDYERNELQLLMQYGLASEEEINHMMATSQHWVPIQRNVTQSAIGGAMNANKALANFEGSNEDILPLDETIMNRTRQVYRSITQNNLFNEIFKSIKTTTTRGGNYVIDGDSAEDLGISEEHGKHYITLYQDGKGIKMEIGEDIYKSLRNHKTYRAPVLSNIADFRRNIITGWNPIFWVTNGMKDIQDVPYNTKFSAPEYTKAYMEAWRQITTNGELYQLYLSQGGSQNTLKNLGEVSKIPQEVKGLAGFGESIETTPRLAEFIATLNKGGTVEEAMHNASEVTTNFKRGGTISKTLNANGFTFLNASIVGFQKQVNNYKEAYEKNGVVGVASYMAKMGLLYNVPIMLLNHLRWKDDDDYEQLSDYIKQNYYCLWKTKDGTFIRIPKGRLNAFYQTVIQSGVDTVTGQQTLWEALLTDWSSFKTNIAPNDLAESSLFAPIQQALNNETWYGGDIVPTRLQNVPDAEQYDASTDDLSKWIGEKTGLSPMKIHYVLDQYSGIIGDALLPAITLDASNGIDNNVISSLASPLLDKFTTNSTLKNQYVTDFYEMNEELTKNANSSKATDEDILAHRYMSTITNQLSDLYKKKREIQSDTTLKNSEKYSQVLEVQKQIDVLAKYGLDNYDQLDITDNYAEVGGVKYYKNEDGWKKLTKSQLEKVDGLDLSSQETSDFYNLYNSIADSRDELKETTPEGEDTDYREVTIGAIQNSNLSDEAKNRMHDSYYGSKFSEYVNSMDFDTNTKLEIKYIYSTTDADKDENGKTISNSKAQKIKEQYIELGVYDDIVKYIQSHEDVSYSSFGLSKTVVEKASTKKTYSDAYTSAIKAFKNTTSNTSNATTTTSSTPTTTSSSNYAKAYASALSNAKNSKAKSTDSNLTTCPKCGSRVNPVNGRCPVCGTSL